MNSHLNKYLNYKKIISNHFHSINHYTIVILLIQLFSTKYKHTHDHTPAESSWCLPPRDACRLAFHIRAVLCLNSNDYNRLRGW
jgi:hypothetical protein